jgi:hypothetical protein
VAEAVEAWATMPLPDLMDRLQRTTLQLCTQIESHAVDEGAYQRKFWDHWQKCPEEWSVAAANRDCERVCKELDEVRILSRALVESMTVRRDSLIAILTARSR